jgi:hypothetical protein
MFIVIGFVYITGSVKVSSMFRCPAAASYKLLS